VLDEKIGPRLVTLRAADTGGQRSSANILVHRMYATRGYKTSAANDEAEVKNLLTLIAIDGQETIGTLSLRFDDPAHGLLADELFREEINVLRAQGRGVCEFTKLAMDRVVKSKRVLASLFHTAYLWAHGVMGHDDVVIEVNPRHVLFYRKALGFTVMGPERLNRRVNAPGVLLRLELKHARQQIDLYAGRSDPDAGAHSLYPHFFSAKEEAGILNRLPRPWWAQAA
jgi:hypothetical protein